MVLLSVDSVQRFQNSGEGNVRKGTLDSTAHTMYPVTDNYGEDSETVQ